MISKDTRSSWTHIYLAADGVRLVIRENAAGRKHGLMNAARAREVGQREATVGAENTRVQTTNIKIMKMEI